MRNPRNEPLERPTAGRRPGPAHSPGAHLHPLRGARRRATISSASRSARTARSRRTCAPGRPAAAPGSASTAPRSRRRRPRASCKGALARAFKTGDARDPRRSRRADRGGAAPGGARPARARGARRQPDPRLRPDRDRRPRAARSRCCSTPPTPATRAAASSTRPGGSAATRRAAAAKVWFCRWKEPYCHWRWAAKMWYMPPSSIGPRRRVSTTRSAGGALLSDVMLG